MQDENYRPGGSANASTKSRETESPFYFIYHILRLAHVRKETEIPFTCGDEKRARCYLIPNWAFTFSVTSTLWLPT